MHTLHQLARISGWHEGTIILTLWAFYDESGEHDAKGKLRRLTLGGFVTRWEQLEKLDAAWRRALEDENLAEFHMKEIASDEDRFLEWPEDRQNRLLRFVDILCDNAIEFAAGSYASDHPSSVFRETYVSGLNRAFIDFASLCDRLGERGHIMFAKTDEISEGLVGDYFATAQWDKWLDGYSVQLSRNIPGLQAAEIVARGMRRLMQDGVITWSFLRVLLTGLQPDRSLRFWPPNPFLATAALGNYPWSVLAKRKKSS